MVQTCSYLDCDSEETPNSDLNFFSFPLENPETLKAWVLVAKSGFVPTELSKLCSKHFSNTDYEKTTGSHVCKLKENAVPLIPTLSQLPVKICEVENETTADTSLIKEYGENKLSEVVNPTLTTSIKTQADYVSPQEPTPSVDTSNSNENADFETKIRAIKDKVDRQTFRIRDAKRLLKKEQAKGRRLNNKLDLYIALHVTKFINSRYPRRS